MCGPAVAAEHGGIGASCPGHPGEESLEGRALVTLCWDAFTRYPTTEDAMGTMKEFAGLYYREGALDPKTMQLVALAAMAAAGCTS